ncbi:adenylylsulfate kinase-like enzyme/16S rRNA G527 N7-methylase RsmG [Anaerotaenia torta]|uniref:adenylyl-sulfate kinase n=1 Tax=Anaerotaenia torta TaxID=433293 RepID=UPI003D225963
MNRKLIDKNNYGVLYWITGLPGAGKTTIGNALYYYLKKIEDNVVILDGDILKEIVGSNLGYSADERHERAIRYSRLCKALTDQGIDVVCCTVAMFEDIRLWNRENNKLYVEIFLDVPSEVLVNRDQKGMYTKQKQGLFKNLPGIDMDVELPRNPDIVLNTDGSISVSECVNTIINYDINYQAVNNRDVKYWNDFYASNPSLNEASLFAKSIVKYLEKGKSLIDLGCGNGRDSIFFCEMGLNVTAIDASSQAIGTLESKCKELKNLLCVCDDFVKLNALYQKQYHYCYSRFSIHAINDSQQKELIKNVASALKDNGLFFIEVRSIHDELYGQGQCVARNAFIFNDHYRRFIVKNELEAELNKVGLNIIYSEEATGFAPFENADPMIIRVVAQKSSS